MHYHQYIFIHLLQAFFKCYFLYSSAAVDKISIDIVCRMVPWDRWVSCLHRGQPWLILHCVESAFGYLKISLLASGTMSQTHSLQLLCFFYHCMSTVASIVSLVWPMTVASCHSELTVFFDTNGQGCR